MIQQDKVEARLIDQCSPSHPSIIISKLIGASGLNEHELKCITCQLRKCKANEIIQGTSRYLVETLGI